MRYVTLIISFLLFSPCFSQGFKVKEFKQNLNDGSAFHAPMDAEGHPCGLIKVRTNNPDLQFKGDVVGDVEDKMNEYWVYVAQDSRLLKVNHPNFLPFVITFADYNIDISSKATYVLTLEETKYKKEKTGVTIIVKPEDTGLYVDDILVENLSGNGYYQLYLPKGEHVCKLSKAGYRPNVQIVQTGKASQNISVELESVMAELEVKCKTVTAEIYVDGELKGNGAWKGELIAGEHKVEARQQDFNSHTQTITLAEKECRAFTIPELKRSMGKVRIETDPSGVFISVDGIPVGTSPCNYDVNTGHHIIKAEGYGCLPTFLEVDVNDGNTPNHFNMTLQVVGNPFFEKDALFINLDGISLYHFNSESQSFSFDHQNVYKKAYQGEANYIKELAMRCLISGGYDDSYYKEALYWMEKLPNLDNFLDLCKEHWGLAQGVVEAYCSNGKPDIALSICETKGGEFQDCYGIIGKAYQEKENYQKAISCYQKWISCHPKASWFYNEEVGDCFMKLENKSQAIYYYKKKLENETFNTDILRLKKKLKDIEN